MDQHHCWLTSFGKGGIELFWVNEVVFELCVRGVESFLLMSILYLFNRQLLGREGNKVVSFLEFVCKFEPYFSVFFGEREVVQRWGFESGISVGDNRDKLCTGDRVMMQPRLYSRVPGQSSLRINSKQLVVDSKLIHLSWTLSRLDVCLSGETIKGCFRYHFWGLVPKLARQWSWFDADDISSEAIRNRSCKGEENGKADNLYYHWFKNIKL